MWVYYSSPSTLVSPISWESHLHFHKLEMYYFQYISSFVIFTLGVYQMTLHIARQTQMHTT